MYVPGYIHAPCAWAGAPWGQKRMEDPLKLELQMIMSKHVIAGSSAGPDTYAHKHTAISQPLDLKL